MKHEQIIEELRILGDLPEIAVTPLLPDSGFKSAYAPINTYLTQLQKGAKPETASEGLFRALAADVLNQPLIPQVNVGDGFVDFVLDAAEESSIVIELKPLFHVYSGTSIRRGVLKPASHTPQVEKYLKRAEYLVLTDLHDAYLYSARDVWTQLVPFAKVPFAELLALAAEKSSLHDVLREKEDGEARHDLDRSFFEQLKEWFHAFAPIRFTKPEEHDELVIQFINQIIFAKTMEDHSLVRYRQLQDDWEKARERWEAKGPTRIVRQFLKDFETFFEDYYDTELFERSIWELLEKDEDNLRKFADKVEAVLGLDKWNRVFKRGIVHYNYRLINEDIFGKSYEMFLAANRKDEGIYYTPAGITGPMADSLVDSLFNPLVTPLCAAAGAGRGDFATAGKLMDQITHLTIADTAAGSGGFLIKVLRAVWRQYRRIETASQWVKNWKGGDLLDTPANVQQARAFRQQFNFDNPRVLIAQILLRHIYAVDKDAGALEVAKTNLWKEAVKLSTHDYNFRRLTGEINRTLPSLRLNFVCGDSLVDTDPAEQTRYLGDVCGQAMQKLCALREQYLGNPSDHAPLEEALKLQAKLRENLTEHFQAEPLPAPALFAALSFFPAWFEQNGQPREPKESGFSGVIGNPPWETVKPVRKEFAQKHCQDSLIGKNATPGRDFESWFKKCLGDDASLQQQWADYENWYEQYKEYLGRRFHQQGTGDWNYFKLFLERNLNLVRQQGRLSMLVPSSIQTDEGCMPLRRLFTTEHTLEELMSFENRGYLTVENGKQVKKQIFPDVDDRFKFSFLKVIKSVPTPVDHAFTARFYIHNPADVYQPPLHYPIALIHFFSPQTLSIVEYRSERDMALFKKLRDQHPFFSDLGFRFRRELHSTGDGRMIYARDGKKLEAGQMPLFEGRNIHQFDSKFSPTTDAVVEKEVREELLRKQIFRLTKLVREQDAAKLEGSAVPKTKEKLEARLREIFEKKSFKLDYELPRLAYREIAASTNERTLIVTMVPKRASMNHKLMYLVPVRYELSPGGKLSQEEIPDQQVKSVLAVLNSLVANYYIRSRVSSTVSAFYVYELPFPKLAAGQTKQLAESATKLLNNPRDVAERAGLEVFIARELYGLSAEDWRHLTGTFTFGGDSETKAELDEIIRQSHALWPK